MSGTAPEYDSHFQQEVKRARRLFFVLLPFTLLAIAAIWAWGEGVFSGKTAVGSAGDMMSSVPGVSSGGTN